MISTIRSFFISVFLSIVILLTGGFDNLFAQNSADREWHEGIIRVKIDYDAKQSLMVKETGDVSLTGISSLNALNAQFSAVSMEPLFPTNPRFAERHARFGLDRWYEIRFDSDSPTEQIVQAYRGLPEVEISEHKLTKELYDSNLLVEDLIEFSNGISTQNDFSDPLLEDQWHYNNTGQTGGTAGADISMFQAWEIETGSPDVIVSVIDSGIDPNHDDLQNMLWVNPVPGPENGYDGDVHGWNFGDNNANITDTNGHGTHVSGTVAAENNNDIGVAGVAGGDGSGNGVRIMTGRTFAVNTGGFAEAIVYGADNGAVISQNSWGYTAPGAFEQAVLDAIDYFIEFAGYDENGDAVGPIEGGIVVFAAGNSNSSLDYYPGFYEPVVAVAASNHNDQKASYSNYGDWIDITAPGGDTGHHVVSTLPNNNYGANFYWGTSMAAPHVSGVIGLVASRYPGLTNEDVLARVLATADNIDAQNPNFVDQLGSGRLNAFRSLEEDDGVPPAAITDLVQDGLPAENAIPLSWTAPGSSGDEGQAFRYDLRYSEELITEENFEDANEFENMPIPAMAGETQSVLVTGLTPQTEYYFAIKSRDVFTNVSDISNVVVATTDGSPAISVDPESLTSTVEIGSTEQETLTISNVGEGLLTFTFPSFANNGVLTASNSVPLRTNLDVERTEEMEREARNRSIIDRHQNGLIDNPTALERRVINEFEAERSLDTPPAGLLSEADVVIEFEELEASGGEFFDVTGEGYTGELTAVEADFVLDFAPDFTWASDFAILFATDSELSGDSIVLQVGGLNEFGPSGTRIPWGTGDSSAPGTPVETTIELSEPLDLEDIYVFIGHGWMSGGQSSWTGSIGLVGAVDAPQFISDISPATGSIEVGEDVEVTVTFDATEIVAGFYTGSTSLRSNDLSNPSKSIELNMQTEGGEPDLVLSETELDFGNVFQNESSTLSFNMANEGTAVLNVSSMDIGDNAFTADVSGSFELIPGESVDVNVTFTPETLGSFESELTIVSDDPGGDAVINLSGNGTEVPSIAVNPESLEANVTGDVTETVELTILNEGDGPLDFSFPDFAAMQLLSTPGITKNETTRKYSGVNLQKGEDDFRTGHPVLLGAGGPDEFGYSWIDSNEPGGPSFSWTDISGIGEEISELSGTWDDNTSIDLPFDFNFYGEDYNTATISVNGWITFSDFTGMGFSNMEIPSAEEPNNLLAVFWDDLDMRNQGSVYKYHDESNNRLILQWTDVVKSFASGSSMTFQAILYQNGTIVYQYENMVGAVNASTVGIENADGTDGLQAAFNTDYIEDGLAVSFSSGFVGGDFLSVDITEGSIPAGDSQIINVTFDGSEFIAGTFEDQLVISSNDPQNPIVEVPATMNVTGIPGIAVNPESLDFGEVFEDVSESLFITVENTGNGFLEVSDISSDNADFTVGTNSFTLDPFDQQMVEVTFTPSSVGTISGTLSIESNDAENPTVSVSVEGEGVDRPEIAVNPETLNAAANAGDQTTEVLSVINNGAGPLHFSLPGFDALTLLSQPGIEKNKTSRIYPEDMQVDRGNDTRVGHPVVLGAGGPDEFGYSWIDSNEPGGPMFSWVDISEIGEELTELSGEWDGNTTISLPFDFPFYDNEYSEATVSVNGWITFSDFTGAGFTNLEIPSESEPNNLLAVFWDDLDMREDGTVYTYHDENANRFIVQWEEVPSSIFGGAPAGLMTFQVIINANGVILYQYKEMEGDINTNTIGIENEDGTDGLQVAFNTPYMEDELAIRFSTTPDYIFPDIVEGTVNAGESLDINVTFDAEGLVGGLYQDAINVESNDPNNPNVEVPTNFDVTGTPEIEVEPLTLDFGSFFVGLSEALVLTVSNPGTDELVISDISTDDNQYSADQTELTLPIGGQAAILVTFEPESAGEFDAELTITSNASGSETVTVTLAGEGLDPPIVSADADQFMWELPSGESLTETLTITNDGSNDLVVNLSDVPGHVTMTTGSQERGKISDKLSSDQYQFAEFTKPVRSALPEVRSRSLTMNRSGLTEDRMTIAEQDNDELITLFHEDFESYNDFDLEFGDWTLVDVDGAPTYGFQGISFPNSGEPMAAIIFNPSMTSPPLSEATTDGDPMEGMTKYAASFASIPGDGVTNNDDWIITPSIPLGFGSSLSFYVKTYVPDFGLERFRVGVSTTGTDPEDFTIISEEPFETAPPDEWTEMIYSLEEYDGQEVYIAINVVSEDAFIFMLDDVRVTAESTANWLAYSPDEAVIGAGESAEITITVDAEDLEQGDYERSLVISSNDPQNSELSIPLTLSVTAAQSIGWANLQWPPSETIPMGESLDVYGQVWAEGITEGEEEHPDMAMWVGVHSEDTHPETWDEEAWTEGVFNESQDNNDEYMATIGDDLEMGTYYYATRFRFANESYVYGGYSEEGGGFWEEGSHTSGVLTVEESVSIGEDEMPTVFTLDQNYPNPFNPSTTIRFGLPEAADVTLNVYNLLGQRVAQLVNESRTAGYHNVVFDASNLSSGMYIYRIQAGNYVETRKLMLVK